MPDLSAFGTWLIDALMYVPRKVYEMMTDSLVTMIDAIFAACSVCDFSHLDSNLVALPVGVLFVLSWFKIGSGITMIFAGYAVRFAIRRLPFIG